MGCLERNEVDWGLLMSLHLEARMDKDLPSAFAPGFACTGLPALGSPFAALASSFIAVSISLTLQIRPCLLAFLRLSRRSDVKVCCFHRPSHHDCQPVCIAGSEPLRLCSPNLLCRLPLAGTPMASLPIETALQSTLPPDTALMSSESKAGPCFLECICLTPTCRRGAGFDRKSWLSRQYLYVFTHPLLAWLPVLVAFVP